MADFGFVGPSYAAPSIYQEDQECINFRPEIDPLKPEGSRGVVALYPTPGLAIQAIFPNQQEVRGMRTLSGGEKLVVVCGPFVYLLTATLSPVMIGLLNTSSGRVAISDNGINVYITDGTDRYTWRINTPTAAVFDGSISGTTLTVSAVKSGSIAIGQQLFTIGGFQETVITAGSGTSWTVNVSQTVASSEMYTSTTGGTLTASISGTTLTTTIATGDLYVGQTIQGVGVTNETIIKAIISQTAGVGTFTINNSQTVSSETMYALNWTVLPNTDGAFEGGESVDIVDNYFVYARKNSQQWAASDLLSPITPALSFGTKDGSPDNLVSLIVDHREVYLLGEASSEVWVDVGSVPFPFQRIPGTSTQHGIASRFSMSRLGNSFAYVSRNGRGQAQIMQMNGYVPSRISNHAVENTLVNEYIDDAIAWTYQQEGHEVYVVSFPSVGENGLTWAFDISTGMWHKWLYTNNLGQFERHRGNCSALFQGKILVGDHSNGSLYELDPNVYTDNGQITRRVRRAPHLVADFQRQYFDELQIQFQPGVGTTGLSINAPSYAIKVQSPLTIGPDAFYPIGPFSLVVIQDQAALNPSTETNYPQAMLKWSNDGGSTWSREYWVTIGQQGRYKNRAIWRRLGMARDRVFEVAVTAPVKTVIVSANLKATEGEN